MNGSYRQMKDEEARRIVAVEAFKVVEKKIQELNVKSLKLTRRRRVSRLLCKGLKGR